MICIKQWVLDPFVVVAAYAEADGAPNIIHDGLDVGLDLVRIRVGKNGFVPARDIVADVAASVSMDVT